jgi:signal transduction histidine kinase
MRRFYLQVYLTFLGILLLFGALLSVAWLLIPSDPEESRRLDGMGAVIGQLLPGPDRPLSQLQLALEHLGNLLSAHLAIYSRDGVLLAAVGTPPASPVLHGLRNGWTLLKGRGPAVALSLPDGRRVVARWPHQHRPFGLVLTLGLLAAAVAVGSYPVVRRVTRRLERLQARVDALAEGELKTRVEVEGNDEIADLARGFNRAASRIEQLMNAQRSMLAGASHELRSPLARIRVAIELLSGEDRPELRKRLAQDIAELDDLIGELLLASRLDALDGLERKEEVDLLALLAEEGIRNNAEVSGKPTCVRGDSRMLRRLMRNLLENASRYAAGSLIEASVVPLTPSGARLRVEDRGPGVPEPERERVFEPFYRSVGTQESGGIGLGLALVRQIARHHGGEARCLPREGGGTCFEVELCTE